MEKFERQENNHAAIMSRVNSEMLVFRGTYNFSTSSSSSSRRNSSSRGGGGGGHILYYYLTYIYP